jgi:hypothetical protein
MSRPWTADPCSNRRATRIEMHSFSKIVFALLMTSILVVSAIVALAYGWVPTFGNEHTEDYFGRKPPTWVLWHATGWEDHKIFFVFPADREWVERAAASGNLDEIGEMTREDCLKALSPPWWFALSQQTGGVCWQRREGYAGHVRMHYAPESQLVYVFDFSA